MKLNPFTEFFTQLVVCAFTGALLAAVFIWFFFISRPL